LPLKQRHFHVQPASAWRSRPRRLIRLARPDRSSRAELAGIGRDQEFQVPRRGPRRAGSLGKRC